MKKKSKIENNFFNIIDEAKSVSLLQVVDDDDNVDNDDVVVDDYVFEERYSSWVAKTA
jgi:hypothetical protein